ncbi:MAG: hypothetical protein JSV91_04855, partial [Phycisphaerales bacterium]
GALNEGGLINIMNRVGVPVFIAGYGPDTRSGAMSIKNGRGVQILQAGAEEDESGIVRVYDAEGKRPRTLKPIP